MQLVGQIRMPVTLDGDGRLACAFGGVLAALDGAEHPVNQQITPARSGYLYQLESVGVSTNDRFGDTAYFKALSIAIDAKKNSAGVKAAALSRTVGGAETILDAEYGAAVYQYEGGEGGALQTTGRFVGENLPVNGKALKLRMVPAGRFDPWVVFVITRGDGSVYTRSASYRESAVPDDGSSPKLPFAPFF